MRKKNSAVSGLSRSRGTLVSSGVHVELESVVPLSGGARAAERHPACSSAQASCSPGHEQQQHRAKDLAVGEHRAKITPAQRVAGLPEPSEILAAGALARIRARDGVQGLAV